MKTYRHTCLINSGLAGWTRARVCARVARERKAGVVVWEDGAALSELAAAPVPVVAAAAFTPF